MTRAILASVAGILMTLGATAAVAGVAAAVFLVTAFVAARLRFEQADDATGGARVTGDGPTRPGARARLLDGVRAIRAQPVLTWSTFGVYGQVLTRGLLNAMTVVAAIELLGMGQGGTVTAQCVNGRPHVVGAAPRQGFGVESDNSSAEFRSSDHRTEMTVTCSGLTATVHVEERAGAGGGGGGGVDDHGGGRGGGSGRGGGGGGGGG